MILKDVLEEICAEEYALPETALRHRFSLRHRREMSKILYPDNLPKTENWIPLKRRMIVISVIALLAVITGAAGIIRYGGFRFGRASDDFMNYYAVLADNADKAPKTIEKVCYDVILPENYKQIDEGYSVEDGSVKAMYFNEEVVNINGSHPFIWVQQWTKRAFFVAVDSDEDVVEAVEIKGFSGFKIVKSVDEVRIDFNTVVWDCGDYIHAIVGTVSMEEILKIAENMIERT